MSDSMKADDSKSGNTIGSTLIGIAIACAIFMKIAGSHKPVSKVESLPPPITFNSSLSQDTRSSGNTPNPAIPRWTEPAPVRQAPPQLPDQSVAAMQLLLEAAARQQQTQQSQEYQRFNQTVQQASVCNTCGGAGTYRFVDQFGNLNARQCPSCMGSGKRW